MLPLNHSKKLFNTIGWTITILKYYGSSTDARRFMSIACKSIREHWKQWEHEICSFLGNEEQVICINHFNKKIRNYLLEGNRYKHFKLDVNLGSKKAIKRFSESLKYFESPLKIHSLNVKVEKNYFKEHPLTYWKLSSVLSPNL